MATPDALAQATSPGVAAFHASRIPASMPVVDPSCGIGTDLVAFANAGHRVTAWETDPARAVFARENGKRLASGSHVEVYEGTAPDTLPDGACIFYDPARRDARGRASTDSERWSPPLAVWERARLSNPGGLAKFSPGMPNDWLGAQGDSVVYVSENRECKEACVLFGVCAQGLPRAAALLLPEGIVCQQGHTPDLARQPGRWLLDPDPALVRAGALDILEDRIDAKLLSPTDSYLTSETELGQGDSRLATCWRIRDVLPLARKALARHLRDQGVGRVVLKKHRVAGDEAQWVRDLNLKGSGVATLVLVANPSGDQAILCDPAPVAPVH